MKKVLASLLALLIALALAACTDDTGGASQVEDPVSAFDSTREINVVTREQGSGTRSAFVELFEVQEEQADGTKRDAITEQASVENNTNTILTTVQNDPYSIGYVSMGSLNSNVKALSIEGVEANSENVKNGSYPISRPFLIATQKGADPLVADFIAFIQSKEGQDIVVVSYIAVNESAAAYSGDRPAGAIVVGGSSSVAPLMEKLIEAYLAINTNADIELQVTDSSTGMNNAIEGSYDIGMSSRELKDSERETLTETKIAIDGVAVIIHPSNPVGNMTKAQVRDIYLGETKTWETLI